MLNCEKKYEQKLRKKLKIVLITRMLFDIELSVRLKKGVIDMGLIEL
jgi:hypothetical protein